MQSIAPCHTFATCLRRAMILGLGLKRPVGQSGKSTASTWPASELHPRTGQGHGEYDEHPYQPRSDPYFGTLYERSDCQYHSVACIRGNHVYTLKWLVFPLCNHGIYVLALPQLNFRWLLDLSDTVSCFWPLTSGNELSHQLNPLHSADPGLVRTMAILFPFNKVCPISVSVIPAAVTSLYDQPLPYSPDHR